MQFPLRIIEGNTVNNERTITQEIGDFLGDQERALTVLVGGSVAIMVVGLIVAVGAIFLMK
jgi:hypothetical protein